MLTRQHGLISLVAALAVVGCGVDGEPIPPPWVVDDDDAEPTCDGAPGNPVVELIVDDENHTPAPDGHIYEVARRPQGENTIYAPIWFGGLEGGQYVEGFEMSFVTDDGEQIGSRINGHFRLPCEDDDTVAAHWIEVFFGNPMIPPEAYDGVTGVLSVQAQTWDEVPLHDAVQAEIRAAP